MLARHASQTETTSWRDAAQTLRVFPGETCTFHFGIGLGVALPAGSPRRVVAQVIEHGAVEGTEVRVRYAAGWRERVVMSILEHVM